ncbi:LytTR family transcriptional regulator DNA-binding domain-containing protein [Kordia sp.]|uniref:LytTR family transcriptional regulator DNA-binding domain-containing protein n=1 Tax=Kordia sp. TaxID=1965332 RepID=UPI003D289C7F
MKKNRKKHIWLLRTWNKSTHTHINLVDRKKVVSANRYRIKINSILYISSSSEKNYTKIVLKNLDEYFFSGSMATLEKELGINLVATSKKIKINIRYFTATLGLNYIFSKYLDEPLYITQPYREAIKKYVGF